jgi:hypothetical protein
MDAREALLSVEKIIREHGDSKALGSYYLEFGRRLEVLRLVERWCARGASVVDLGAGPSSPPARSRRWATTSLP